MKSIWYSLISLGLIMALLGGKPQTVHSAPPPPDSIQALNSLSGGQAVVDRNPETGLVRYIGTDLDHAVNSQVMSMTGMTSSDAAMQFAREYGSLFGVSSPDVDLEMEKTSTTEDGQSFTRYQQTYQGIPVLGGELIVHLNETNQLLSMSGEALDGIQLVVQPGVDIQKAKQAALDVAAREYGIPVGELQVNEPVLWVYNPRLLGDSSIPLTSLVWQMEVTGANQEPVRELVLVDAHNAGVRLHFNQIDAALNRTIYDNNNNSGAGLPGTGPVRSEGGAATGNADADYAYDFSGQTYNFYSTSFGRDSVDDSGLILKSTVRYCPNASDCPYVNAFWNGYQMVYGDGFANADDVVGHELTHGVTQYTSNLFYYMQSGAINEALSDIYGEFIDQLNNTSGTDAPATKWKMGEDLPPPYAGGIRDMSDPTIFNDPDKVTSPKYVCGRYGGLGDNGGVHSNSGILNKAAFLMTDGGSFNGQTISALGLDKTSQIIYSLQTNLLTSGSDYNDLYNLLPQACTSLVGTHGITSGDCDQVVKAVTATEMNLSPVSCATPQVTAACTAGQTKTSLFSDGFESGMGQWQTPGGWYLSPAGYNYPNTGNNELFGDNAATTMAETSVEMKSGVTLAAASGTNTFYLHFAHAFDLEDPYDGGILEYSENGTTWNAMDTLPVVNGPQVTLLTGGGNPLEGLVTFSGVSHGYQTTRYDLSSLAGKNIRFRWSLGLDEFGYYLGWYLDDVSIYRCTLAPVLTNKIYIPTVRR